MDHEALTRTILGRAMAVHGAMGPGFLESIYRNALAYELRLLGLDAEVERRLRVRYRGVPMGDFVADLVVDGRILVELKAVRALAVAHEVQLVHYLTATGIEDGLLLNFGAGRLEFRRKFRDFRGGEDRKGF